MKTLLKCLALLACLGLGRPAVCLGDVPGPPGGEGNTNNVGLNSWSFSDTNWLSAAGYPPASFTNIACVPGGDGNALLLDSTSAAWLQYNVVENDGTTNLTLGNGSFVLWFSPDWSSASAGGSGPGDWAPLIQVGQFATNGALGAWALGIDAAGANLEFLAQGSDGSSATYLTAPIAFTNNTWHFIALTYSMA